VAGGDGDGGGTTTVQAQVDAITAPGARVRLEIHDGRATLVARGLPAPPTGRIYQVWRKQPGRAPAPTDALFTVDRNGSASVAVPGTTKGLEAVLVTDEPKRGSEVPSRQPRIIARPA
jgi:hypothetical protein